MVRPPLLLLFIALAVLLGPRAIASDTIGSSPTRIAAEKGQSFSFVVWGHPRGRTDGEPPTHFEEILKRLEELEPDALVITGDMITGLAARSKSLDPEVIRMDWERFDAGVNRLGIPVYRTPGNHDVNNFMTRDIYLARYRKPPYAVTFKGSRFILLDTVGIDQRSQDAGRYWPFMGLPFDESQMEFIRSEIAQQGNYNHIFFFMHHTHHWAEPSGFWWKDVHPLLKRGKTRAVFSGDPYGGKYAYIKQDGIFYIQSATYESKPVHWFRRNRDKKSGWFVLRQLDNLQRVHVAGDNVTIRTIVVGALNSESVSFRYWDKIESSYRWTQRLPDLFHRHFYKLRHLVLLAAGWGAVCFGVGVAVAALWRRWRKRRNAQFD